MHCKTTHVDIAVSEKITPEIVIVMLINTKSIDGQTLIRLMK